MSNWLAIAGSAMAVGAVTAGGSLVWKSTQDAERTGQVMTVIQTVTQTSGSFAAQRLLDGGGDGTSTSLVSGGYLAALPQNPTGEGPQSQPTLIKSLDEDGATRDVVQMSLNGDNELCDEISQKSVGRDAERSDRIPMSRVGCIQTSSGPIAFARL